MSAVAIKIPDIISYIVFKINFVPLILVNLSSVLYVQLIIKIKQGDYFILHILKMKKGFPNFVFQGIKSREIMQMNFFFFNFFPQFFTRIVIR